MCGSLLVLFASNSARGCTCDLPPLDKAIRQQVIEARRNAKSVFTGKVLVVESPAELFYTKVTMEIQSAWKGTHTYKLIILTGRGGGDCGYRFEVGETYLVYAYQYNKSYLGTNICQRTNVLHNELVDLKYLGKPVFRARPARGKSSLQKNEHRNRVGLLRLSSHGNANRVTATTSSPGCGF